MICHLCGGSGEHEPPVPRACFQCHRAIDPLTLPARVVLIAHPPVRVYIECCSVSCLSAWAAESVEKDRF